MDDGKCLMGMITNHPNPDVGRKGRPSITSAIVTEEDGIVVTKSGTRYVLGEKQ